MLRVAMKLWGCESKELLGCGREFGAFHFALGSAGVVVVEDDIPCEPSES